MKLWQKDYRIDQRIEDFTVGKDRELDQMLAPYDILGSIAHAAMLRSIELLTPAEYKSLHFELKKLYHQAIQGDLVIEEGVEDVHSQIEKVLTERLGDTGKKIHTGRSRNDQVLVDLRLFFRAEIKNLAEEMNKLFQVAIELSEKHKEVLMPGYTHLQVAMVSSFGLWFGGYAESLTDDMKFLHSSHAIINQNPLGSAAGYGSSFPIDRQLTTSLLGFSELNYNVIHAQMGRGKSEIFLAYAMAAIAHTLGKLAMDISLFSNQNFNFLRLPDDLTTGSSIMPHKKNPDVFELIRAKCNKVLALPNELNLITSNLPAGYHRDFQLLKESVFPAIEDLKDCLSITSYALPQLQVQPNILGEEKYKYLYSVEAVNRKVLEGVPFRDAYRMVGEAIESSTFAPTTDLSHTHLGSIGNLANEQIKRKMATVFGSFEFEKIERQLEKLLTS